MIPTGVTLAGCLRVEAKVILAPDECSVTQREDKNQSSGVSVKRKQLHRSGKNRAAAVRRLSWITDDAILRMRDHRRSAGVPAVQQWSPVAGAARSGRRRRLVHAVISPGSRPPPPWLTVCSHITHSGLLS